MSRSEKPLPTTLLAEALWRGLTGPSLDYFRLLEHPDGYILMGRVLTVFGRHPAEVHYSVLCGREWTTTAAGIALVQGRTSRQMHLRRDESDQWWRDDERLPDLDGISDIDLSITPATNTLPIRRMALDVGASRSCDAAWVRFPGLTVERLAQRYTRTQSEQYRYDSRNGGFMADIEVDAAGVVIRYGDIWERIAPQDSRSTG